MKIFYVVLSGMVFFAIFLIVFSIGWPRFLTANDIIAKSDFGLLGYKVCSKNKCTSYILYGTREDFRDTNTYKKAGAVATALFIIACLIWFISIAFLMFKAKYGGLKVMFISRFLGQKYYALYILPLLGSLIAAIGWGVWYTMIPKNYGKLSDSFYISLVAWIIPIICFLMLLIRKMM